MVTCESGLMYARGTPSVYFRDGVFYFAGSFEDRHIPKGAGFWWDKDARRWYTRDFKTAEKLRDFLDDTAKQAIERFKSSIELSSKSNADLDIPAPEGLEYLPFQKAGIQYALQRKNTLIADEMGLGKTIQAIGVINAIEGIKNVLVVCPAFLKLNWRNELQRWLVREFDIQIVYSNSFKIAGYKNGGNGNNTGTVHIVNYDILEKNLPHIVDRGPYDLLIADESHYLKNQKAKRTKATEQLCKYAKRRIFLTGTPVTKYPLDLFPTLKMFNHPLSQSWMAYAKRYCAMYEGQFGKIFGVSNQKELQEKLRATIMVSRRKKDVLTELPEKIRQVIRIELDSIFSPMIAKEKELVQELKKLHIKDVQNLNPSRLPIFSQL
ncbi:MAG: SNF2-related protein, partial [Thermodesulfovibrionales bacterium]